MEIARGEFAFIDWIRAHGRRPDEGRVVLGVGDDCAALRIGRGREVVITTDMLMDGRHFRADDSEATLRQIGIKALGVNMSDIAAMAALPVAAVVAVALPRRLGELGSMGIGKRLHAGLEEMADRFEVALVGGDTNAWDGPLVVNVTVLGEATERGLVRRSGARAGDAVFVTGRLGGSLSGRHMNPQPRVREAMWLHAGLDLHAMIDISDGLAADLGHILEESGGLGAVLEASAIPVHEDAKAMSRRDGRSPLDHALHDGEDFELCFTMDAREAESLRTRFPDFGALSQIGVITSEPGLRLRHGGGHLETIEARGFDHFADATGRD